MLAGTAGGDGGAPVRGESEILAPGALEFLGEVERRFGERRRELLDLRAARAEAIRAGAELGFLPETAWIRDDPSWRVSPVPGDLEDRRVEITG
ncbi:MAG: hypothetical protein ABIV26_02955, partial [Candidatus Limnocylindrales bacterium]